MLLQGEEAFSELQDSKDISLGDPRSIEEVGLVFFVVDF